jgi:hypothetical protein
MMKTILCILMVMALASGCRTPSASKGGYLTDEDIILRCRSHKLSVVDVDKELGDWVEWTNLKSKMKPEDELWRFCTPGPSWEDMMGWAGYAVFRKNKLIGSVTTEEN